MENTPSSLLSYNCVFLLSMSENSKLFDLYSEVLDIFHKRQSVDKKKNDL